MPKNNSKIKSKIKPMLAKLTDESFDREGWIFEIKWDGYRAIAEVNKGKVSLYSRNGLDFSRYAPIVDALKKIKINAVFDGEIIALQDGKPNFHALQNFEVEKVPLQYAIFDLISLNGKSLEDLPLRERREILKKNFPKHRALLFSDGVEKNGKKFFSQMVKANMEGMIAKDLESKYVEGSRSGSWLKVKNLNEEEAIIIGFTEPRGSRKHLGALVLGSYKNGELAYIGHSGGGFTGKELKELYEKLRKIKDEKPIAEKVPINSPITWVRPLYVCQIRFTEWTKDGRMRHPIYMGLREDKSAGEVKPEKSNFTNLDKIFFPKEGYTKGDVIDYYGKIADYILPYLKDRPLSLHRHPNGINGASFYQKDYQGKLPAFVETAEVYSESNKKKLRFVLCQNKETLLFLANQGNIELNPWSSRKESLDMPDYMILDLDPGENTFAELLSVARVTSKILERACEKHYIKTSGKSGIHIVIPLGAKYDYGTIRRFAELLANLVHKELPKLTSLERSPSKRKKLIYIDYLQNSRGQTIASAYSLRPAPGAPVSTPIKQTELKNLDPQKFNIKKIFKRLEKEGDLWENMLRESVDLNHSIKCLEGELSDPAIKDKIKRRV